MTPVFDISCTIGTAGHIDHGKTSLVRALTGMDTDRLKEEKKRGVSIDLGFAYMEYEANGRKSRAAFVDVPGHERFIKNMLAGTTGIDFVLFAVAADDGVMPQTREHLDIVRLLGIKKGVFAITKTDLVSPERIDEVRAELDSLLSGTRLAASPVVPVSTLTGKGMDELRGELIKSGLEARQAATEGFFRLPIDRSFAVKGFGAVVTGTVASGRVSKGDDLIVFPSGNKVKVRGIQSLYMERDSATSGQRAAINLAGISHQELERGDMLVSTGLAPFVDALPDRKTYFIDCSFEFVERSGAKPRTIRNRLPLKVFHLTGESQAMLLLSGAKETGPGETASGRLALKGPLLMLPGDRFILRDPAINATIGGGEVLVPYLSRELMPKSGKAAFIAGEKPEDMILKLVPEKGAGCVCAAISLMLGFKESEFKKSIQSDKRFSFSGEYLLVTERLEGARKKFMSLLADFHKASPMEQGTGDELFIKGARELASGVGADRAGLFIRELLEIFAREGAIRKDSGLWSLPSHRPASKGPEAKIEAALMEIFSKGLQPDLEALQKLPFRKPELDKVLLYLQRQGAIARLKEGSYISSGALKEAREKMEGFIKAKGNIKASDFRDLLGCGRKFAIEILEYFDRERFTIRQGDLRTLR